MLFYLRGFLHLKIKNLILESMSLWNITCAPSNAQKMLPVLFVLLFIKAPFHQDWKKKYFLCTKSPSRYQAETEILKITSQGGMHIFYIYIPLQACISQQLPYKSDRWCCPSCGKDTCKCSQQHGGGLPEAQRNRARLQYCSSEVSPPQAYPHMAIDTHNPGPATPGTGRQKLSWKPTPRVTI